MNEVQEVHPSIEELSAFSLGQLPDQAATAVASHLAGCPTCCDCLQTVREDAFVAKLRAAVEPKTTPGSTTKDNGRSHKAPTLGAGDPGAVSAGELPPELVRHARYRVLTVLGAGGMGTVYKAEHQLMERPVALKVIRRELTQDPAAVERFRREVRAAGQLKHPNIVHAYDAEQAGGAPLPGHGIRRGDEPGPPGRRGRPAARGAGVRLYSPGGAGPAARLRARHGPPRHQATQPDAHPRGDRSRSSISAWRASPGKAPRRARSSRRRLPAAGR